jgi:mannose-1-phosphate guanylyltransferase/mannose-6-phosphate isomerase
MGVISTYKPSTLGKKPQLLYSLYFAALDSVQAMEFPDHNFDPADFFGCALTSVILCGGSGTRLWPLSRKSLPKQFTPLIGSKSLLSLTLDRLKPISPKMLLVGSEDHRFLLNDALDESGCLGDLILEPIAKNTAAAMAMAALLTQSSVGNEALMLFCPSDHHIPDAKAFLNVVKEGVPIAQEGFVVTFGVQPHHPSSAYGYIEKGQCIESNSNSQSIGGVHHVKRFIEKPKADHAREMILTGQYLWNAGIFLTRCDELLNALNAHAPAILKCCEQAMTKSKSEMLAYSNASSGKNRFIRPELASLEHCPSKSVDYAVMEHHERIAVVSFRGQWSDVGSWNAVADLSPKDADGNQIEGQGIAHETHNTFIHAPDRTVVALGVNDLLIIDTPDALLVAQRSRAEDVKGMVERLSQLDNPTALSHRKVSRPWGWYDSVDHGERFQVKRIGVKVGASLSLQKHHHRAEHWVVVKGVAEVTNGNRVFLLQENESTFIPAGVIHRLHNPGPLDLEMIEVQSGSYLGEDDIVRIEDTYGRG